MNCAAILALSVHIALPGDFNEVHPGFKCERGDWIGGAFYNSESAVSAFLGYDFGNVEIGLVSGYEYAPILPMVRFTYDVAPAAQMFLAPTATPQGDPGLVFGIQFSVGGIK